MAEKEIEKLRVNGYLPVEYCQHDLLYSLNGTLWCEDCGKIFCEKNEWKETKQ